jgi:hypothetical protein
VSLDGIIRLLGDHPVVHVDSEHHMIVVALQWQNLRMPVAELAHSL